MVSAGRERDGPKEGRTILVELLKRSDWFQNWQMDIVVLLKPLSLSYVIEIAVQRIVLLSVKV
jgi:hypothetical protein